ncbi:MAG: AIR synthase family protein [Christensenellales bacterium]
MKQGKLTSSELKSLLKKLKQNREDILLGPGIGEDCGAIRFGGQACVLSTDPVTAASADAGTIAVHISCNDVAAAGAEPVAILLSLLIPPSASKADIEKVIEQAEKAAQSLDVSIIGGHTEVTNAVNRIVVSTTAVGRCAAEKLLHAGGAQIGDSIIMTKYAALEGTAIISADYHEECAKFLSEDELAQAQSFTNEISVVKEGMLAAGLGASAMHDVTEGGVLGAVWEICEAANCGAFIHINEITVLPLTKKICAHFSIDPLRLISSGSMIICSANPDPVMSGLSGEGIHSVVIGTITKREEGIRCENGAILPPGADEIYLAME